MKPRELRDLSVEELAAKEKEFREEEFKQIGRASCRERV